MPRKIQTWTNDTNLEVKIEFSNDLSSRRTIDSDRIDGEVLSLEGPFRGLLYCDHGGEGQVSYKASLSAGRYTSTSRPGTSGSRTRDNASIRIYAPKEGVGRGLTDITGPGRD